ncbi:MAG: allophanate hydrolase subunit 1 [Actinomycetota bacterium]|nr:allophanate hydrolase subunit 1 [Actinomycetota bacterium]
MTSYSPTIEPLGDRGVLLRLGAEPSRELTAVLAGVARAARKLGRVVDTSPGQTTVLLEVESGAGAEIAEHVRALVDETEPYEGNLEDVEIEYSGEDFEWACEHLRIERDELIRLHSSKPYDVRLLGSPGFIYLSEVPEAIAVPRLDSPRQHVPEGSVGIAGRQTGIYGRPRPGGWRLIGRVNEVPSVTPGDSIRFRPR